jgi:hypothetical protein
VKGTKIAGLAGTIAAALVAGLEGLTFDDLPTASTSTSTAQPITNGPRIKLLGTAAERAKIAALPPGEHLAALRSLAPAPRAAELGLGDVATGAGTEAAIARDDGATSPRPSSAESFARAHGFNVERFTALHAQITSVAHPPAVTASTLTPYQHAMAARFGLSAEAFAAQHNKLHGLA